MPIITCDVNDCNREAKWNEKTHFGGRKQYTLATPMCQEHRECYEVEEDMIHDHEWEPLYASEIKKEIVEN